MHDLKWIRDNPELFDAALKRRGAPPAAADIIARDAERRRLQTEFQAVQSRRNEASKLIGQAKGQYDLVHADMRYDLEVDTTSATPAQIAAEVVAAVDASRIAR